jgi:hypothetical protein
MQADIPICLFFDTSQVVKPNEPGAFRWGIMNPPGNEVITDLVLRLDVRGAGQFLAQDMSIAPRHIVSDPEEEVTLICAQAITIMTERAAAFPAAIHISGIIAGDRRFELVSEHDLIFRFADGNNGTSLTINTGAAGVLVSGTLAGYKNVKIVSDGIVNVRKASGNEHVDLKGEGVVIGDVVGNDGTVEGGHLGAIRRDKMVAVALMHMPNKGIFPLNFDLFAQDWRNNRSLLLEFVNEQQKTITSARVDDDFVLHIKNKFAGHLLVYVMSTSGDCTQMAPHKINRLASLKAGDHHLPGDLLALPAPELGADVERIYFNDPGIERVLAFCVPEPLPSEIAFPMPGSTISMVMMQTILQALCARSDVAMAHAKIEVSQ